MLHPEVTMTTTTMMIIIMIMTMMTAMEVMAARNCNMSPSVCAILQ
jgi:hypothetical protein